MKKKKKKCGSPHGFGVWTRWCFCFVMSNVNSASSRRVYSAGPTIRRRILLVRVVSICTRGLEHSTPSSRHERQVKPPSSKILPAKSSWRAMTLAMACATHFQTREEKEEKEGKRRKKKKKEERNKKERKEEKKKKKKKEERKKKEEKKKVSTPSRGSPEPRHSRSRAASAPRRPRPTEPSSRA